LGDARSVWVGGSGGNETLLTKKMSSFDAKLKKYLRFKVQDKDMPKQRRERDKRIGIGRERPKSAGCALRGWYEKVLTTSFNRKEKLLWGGGVGKDKKKKKTYKKEKGQRLTMRGDMDASAVKAVFGKGGRGVKKKKHAREARMGFRARQVIR